MTTQTKTKKVNYEKAYNELVEKIEAQIKNVENTNAFYSKQLQSIKDGKESFMEKSTLIKFTNEGELISDILCRILGKRSTF